jgi:hypothetical protein
LAAGLVGFVPTLQTSATSSKVLTEGGQYFVAPFLEYITRPVVQGRRLRTEWNPHANRVRGECPLGLITVSSIHGQTVFLLTTCRKRLRLAPLIQLFHCEDGESDGATREEEQTRV